MTEARLPVVTARSLCAVATELRLDLDDVLADTSVTPADLEDADSDISADDEITMARNLIRLAPDPAGVGVAVGTRINLTNLGMLGFAAMASGTLRELLSIGLRFFSLTSLRVSLRLVEGPTHCDVILDAGHLPPDVRQFFVERDIAGAASTVPVFARPILSRYADAIRVELAAHEDYLGPLLSATDIRHVAYGCERSVIRLPREALDAPLPQADEHTLAICVAQCEQILERLNRRHGLAAEVRSRLLSTPGQMPGLAQVADSLRMHPRTLRRRLADEHTSFRALTNEVRATLAAELLCEYGLTVEEIARRLGYAETAAFNHAFTRWYGCAPTGYRAQHPPLP